MKNYDIFNGDADGICALIQLHQKQPQRRQHHLITGIKRDITLLQRVPDDARASELTVLDISLDKNREALLQLLDRGFRVFYVDHHFAGELPQHPALEAHIDTQSHTCTSLIVNRLLDNARVLWAITGAYGDNMNAQADALAAAQGLDTSQRDLLRRLGQYINYNAYGHSLDDLHIAPVELFQNLVAYEQPFEFIHQQAHIWELLEKGYQSDLQKAWQSDAYLQTDELAIFILEDAPWARRVNGVWGNELANRYPDRAHAILTHKDQAHYAVSVRAPLNRRQGADTLCRQFAHGGGRAAAAGINALPKTDLKLFETAFCQQFSRRDCSQGA